MEEHIGRKRERESVEIRYEQGLRTGACDTSSAYDQRSSILHRRSPKRRRHSGPERIRGRRKAESDATWGVRHYFNLTKRVLYERYLCAGQSVLDLCCGQGGDLPKAGYQRASSFIGVDFSSVALEEARFRAKTTPVVQKAIGEVVFLEHDLRLAALDIQPAVDLVSCQLALHYIWDDIPAHIETFLTSVRDALKLGGHFILTIVDADKIPPEGIHRHPYIRLSPPFCPPTTSTSTTTERDQKLTERVAPLTERVAPLTQPVAPLTQPVALPTQPVAPPTQPVALSKDDAKTMTHHPRKRYRFTFPGLVEDLEEFVIPRAELEERCAAFSLKLVDTFTIREIYDRLVQMHPTKPQLSEADWQVLDLYRAFAFQKK